MLNRFRERFARFMYGRNGNDKLNTFLLAAAVAVILLNSFIGKGALRSLLSIVSIGLLAFIYFRMFSKDVYRRQAENRKYLDIKYRVFGYLKGIKERWVQRKDYKFFSCPSCHATLRVPKGHGKIKIVCRKCGNTFTGKS